MLEALARRRDGATLSALSRRLGSPKSSLLYLLRPMTRLGYLVRSPDGHYRLGPAAFTLAMAALSNRELPELARPFLVDLADKSGETALLATMAGDAPVAVYIDKVESRNTVRYTARHRRAQAAVLLGNRKALAGVPAARAPPGVSEDDAAQGLHAADAGDPRGTAPGARRDPEHGSCRSRWTRSPQGAAGIAAPVFDRHGQVMAGLVLGAPSQRVLAEQSRLAALVVEGARELSRVMGFGAEPPG